MFGAGASTTHTYTAAGLYTVKLTISDGTSSASQTIDVGVNDAAAGALKIKKASIKFNFSKNGQDSLSLSGTVSVPSGFAPLNKKVSVAIAGVRKDLVLGKTGRAGDANNTFSLQFKKSPATFTFNVKKQTLFASLEGLGFTNATVAKPGKSITATVVVEIDGVSSAADVKLTYTATAKKSGMAK